MSRPTFLAFVAVLFLFGILGAAPTLEVVQQLRGGGISASGFVAVTLPTSGLTSWVPLGANISIQGTPPTLQVTLPGPIPNFSDAEIPSGTINGTNTLFTLLHSPNPPACLILTRNGVVLSAGTGNDYTLAATTITFNAGNQPVTGDSLVAWYRF